MFALSGRADQMAFFHSVSGDCCKSIHITLQ